MRSETNVCEEQLPEIRPQREAPRSFPDYNTVEPHSSVHSAHDPNNGKLNYLGTQVE